MIDNFAERGKIELKEHIIGYAPMTLILNERRI